MGYYGPNYQWILVGYGIQIDIDSWTSDPLPSDCTREHILQASNGYLTLDHRYYSKDTQPTISGLVCHTYIKYMMYKT